MIQSKIISTKNEEVRQMLSTMTVEPIGTKAEDWIDCLWENAVSPELIAQISSRCMEEQKPFN